MKKPKYFYGTEHAMLTDIVYHFQNNNILTANKFSGIVAKHVNHALNNHVKKELKT